jgi:hypothetical protein
MLFTGSMVFAQQTKPAVQLTKPVVLNPTLKAKQDTRLKEIDFNTAQLDVKINEAKKLNDEIERIKKELDKMGDMDESQFLKLQMYMERVSKMMTTLSNMQKKMSAVTGSIIQNMK